MKAGIDVEQFKIVTLKSYQEFSNYIIINKPNYCDEDFGFGNFMRWLNSQYNNK